MKNDIKWLKKLAGLPLSENDQLILIKGFGQLDQKTLEQKFIRYAQSIQENAKKISESNDPFDKYIAVSNVKNKAISNGVFESMVNALLQTYEKQKEKNK